MGRIRDGDNDDHEQEHSHKRCVPASLDSAIETAVCSALTDSAVVVVADDDAWSRFVGHCVANLKRGGLGVVHRAVERKRRGRRCVAVLRAAVRKKQKRRHFPVDKGRDT